MRDSLLFFMLQHDLQRTQISALAVYLPRRLTVTMDLQALQHIAAVPVSHPHKLLYHIPTTASYGLFHKVNEMQIPSLHKIRLINILSNIFNFTIPALGGDFFCPKWRNKIDFIKLYKIII